MLMPMIVLALFAIFFGDLFKDILTGPMASIFWCDSIVMPIMSCLTEHENLNPIVKIIPSLAVYYGLFFGFFFYQTPNNTLWIIYYYTIYNLAKQKFYFDRIYNLIFAKFTMFFGYIQYKLIDRGILELLGPTGLDTIINYLTIKFRSFHNGYLIHYLIIILYCLILFIFLG